MVSGSSTFQKMPKREAPSSIAASSSSRGMARKYWVMKNTPNGADQAGQDQARIAVVQAELGEELVLRQDHRLLGNGEAEQDEDEQGAAEREIEPGEAVAGERAEDRARRASCPSETISAVEQPARRPALPCRIAR